MKSRNRNQWRGCEGVRWIVAWSAIFSFGSTPVPFPDFHDLNHYDAPGQDCPLHRHLLNLHALAGSVPVSVSAPVSDAAPSSLHCHWIRLRSYSAPWSSDADLGDDAPRFDSSDSGEGLAPNLCGRMPDLSSHRWLREWDSWSREVEHADPVWGTALAALAALHDWGLGRGAPGPSRPHDFFATYKPSVSRSSLLVRWVC